jgi:aryl-alcohol dehydrogenase-like predicted oxidoreductase
MTAISLETIALAPGYRIPRIIRGGWQLAGDHGPVERSRAIADMGLFMAAGLNTVDGADIYTGVEDMYGEFNARQRDAGLPTLQVHTKCVPDYADLDHLSQADLRRSITRSLHRLRTERLDLVQFHWWDYNRGNYLEAAAALHTLHQEGLIARIGGTNFDTAHARALIEAGIPLTSMQTQYSLLDRRSRGGLTDLAAQHGMHLLCYGTLAGGFLTDHWLGQPAPALPLSNRSLVKYHLIIEEFGGWDAFQALLRAMKTSPTAMGSGCPVSQCAGCWTSPGWPPPLWAPVTPTNWPARWRCSALRSRRLTTPCSNPCWPQRPARTASPTAWSATRPAGMAGS